MKRLRVTYILAGFIFPFVIIQLYSCSYSSRACTSLLNDATTKSYDIAVVPGVPFTDGQWSSTMKARVYWSKYLYDKGIAKNIMYSGSAVYSPYYEARIMALYGEAIGIPKENIFTETKAEHSTENIYYGYKKAKKLGFQSIALASDPFQTKMLRKFALKKLSKEVGMIPIVTDTLKAMQPKMINPPIEFKDEFVENFIPLPERENFWKRFKGTQGRDLDLNAYK